MRITMVQHAIGQGGLFSGCLDAGAKPLRWVYDCGSNQTDALHREIDVVANGGDLDLLFLSHLDSDHINGVDKLLSRVKVKEVVLPYLNETILVAILAREAGRETLSGTFVEAVTDLEGWFGSRGVDRITLVGGFDDDGGGDGPLLPGGPEGRPEGDVEYEWTGGLQTVSLFGEPQAAAVAPPRASRMQEATPGSALIVHTNAVDLNWALIPYAHLPPKRLMDAFDAALEAEFGKPIDKKKIANDAKDPVVRDKLRACYDALWLDHNLISMCLYSGPRRPEDATIRWGSKHFLDDYPFLRSDRAAGWMLTGDAHLDGQRRRKRFLDFYAQYMPLTGVFMLPHHGSIHNHSGLVLDAMPRLHVGYAASGPNSYGHPHRDVRDAVEAHGWAHFRRVTQKRSTQITVAIELP